MNDSVSHYDRLLAIHYSWMSGRPLEEKVAEQKALLAELGLKDCPKGTAIDLGCGPGYQSFALADMGFGLVIAVDASADLLAELGSARADCRVRAVLADLRNFAAQIEPNAIDAIVCMGDTLPHLEKRADVSKLYRDVYNALAPGGRFVLTFRDLSHELVGLDRFIPVRADDHRIMTCVLDYEPESVVVNDLVYVRVDGAWTLQKSSYRKLRLSPAKQIAALEDTGFMIDHARMVGQLYAISARK